MHSNSRLLFDKYAKHLFKNHLRVLEIGPDKHPSTYREIASNDTITWETLDIFYSDELTHVAENEYEFPIQDDSFDIVLSGQVIEHVPRIWVWMKELSRICKVGGHVVTINPVSWPYHGLLDCWRIYPDGMKALYEEAGLTVLISKFETLEVNNHQRLIPGISYVPGLKTWIKRVLGWPIVCAYDTITIGKKESSDCIIGVEAK